MEGEYGSASEAASTVPLEAQLEDLKTVSVPTPIRLCRGYTDSLNYSYQFFANPPTRHLFSPHICSAILQNWYYSRDHLPDLQQCLMTLVCAADGGVPLWLQVASGNEHDSHTTW